MKRFIYGVNVDSEDFNHITHIVVLSEEEVKGMDLDFEEFWERQGHRAIALVPEEKEEQQWSVKRSTRRLSRCARSASKIFGAFWHSGRSTPQAGQEAFAALLKQEPPRLAKAFTPEGVKAFLNSHKPRLDERGFLHLGAVHSGGTKEEALPLSYFLKPEEVLVLSIRLLNPQEAATFSGEEELFYGYRIVKERRVERLCTALVDGEDRLVWKKEAEAAEFWVRFEQGDYTTDLVTTVVRVGDNKGELLMEINYKKPIPFTETVTRLLSEPPASWNEDRLEAARRLGSCKDLCVRARV